MQKTVLIFGYYNPAGALTILMELGGIRNRDAVDLPAGGLGCCGSCELMIRQV